MITNEDETVNYYLAAALNYGVVTIRMQKDKDAHAERPEKA